MWRTWSIITVGLALALTACDEPRTADDADDPCGPKSDLKHAGRTAGEAVKTGGTTAWEGLKTAGKTVGGLVEGGTEGAEEEWNEGKARTKDTAREGAAETDAAAHDHPCPDD